MMLVLLSLWLAAQITPEVKQHVETGLAAKRAGDLNTAIREFRRVTELAPELAAAYVNLGAVYFSKQDYSNAVPPLRKALAIDPDLPGANEMLGVALLAQGYAVESIPHLEKVRANGLLGIALLESGRAGEALEKLQVAIGSQPENPDLLYYLGRAHAALSKQVFDVLTTRNPDSARARQLLGEAAAAANKRELAEKHLRAALEMRPDLRGLHLTIGELYLGTGDYEHAERELREEVGLSPGSASAAYKLGLILFNRGELAAALAELRRANVLQPNMPETLFELGKVSAATGDLSTAEKLFNQALAQEENSDLAASSHFQLAEIYRKLGRGPDAKREMKQFQQIRRLLAPGMGR